MNRDLYIRSVEFIVRSASGSDVYDSISSIRVAIIGARGGLNCISAGLM